MSDRKEVIIVVFFRRVVEQLFKVNEMKPITKCVYTCMQHSEGIEIDFLCALHNHSLNRFRHICLTVYPPACQMSIYVSLSSTQSVQASSKYSWILVQQQQVLVQESMVFENRLNQIMFTTTLYINSTFQELKNIDKRDKFCLNRTNFLVPWYITKNKSWESNNKFRLHSLIFRRLPSR